MIEATKVNITCQRTQRFQKVPCLSVLSTLSHICVPFYNLYIIYFLVHCVNTPSLSVIYNLFHTICCTVQLYIHHDILLQDVHFTWKCIMYVGTVFGLAGTEGRRRSREEEEEDALKRKQLQEEHLNKVNRMILNHNN